MIIFRTDASPQIGFGHLTRCRALAMALRSEGNGCVMVGPAAEYAKSVDQETFEDWIPVPEWSSANEDADRLIGVARKFEAEWLVLDDYRVDEEYQLAVRAAELRWLQFDRGVVNRLWADVIVNANPAAKAGHYKGVLCNADSQLLLGPSYAVLRPEFEQITPRKPQRFLKKIFVTFGGGYDRDAIEFVLSALLPIVELNQKLVVMSGSNNPSNRYLKEWIETNGKDRVSLCIDPGNVAQIMLSCDLAIMAGGTATYEAARCGLPMILISIARNQKEQCNAWSRFGCAIYLGEVNEVKKESLVDAVFSVRKNIGSKPSTLKVAGNGAKLIARLMSTRQK